MRSRGTPRIANRILKRVRDFAQVKGQGVVDLRMAQTALEVLEIDQYGLDAIDRKILSCLIEFYGGGPVGLNTLAVNIGEDTETLEICTNLTWCRMASFSGPHGADRRLPWPMST